MAHKCSKRRESGMSAEDAVARAERYLETAEMLIEEGDYESSVSRSPVLGRELSTTTLPPLCRRQQLPERRTVNTITGVTALVVNSPFTPRHRRLCLEQRAR